MSYSEILANRVRENLVQLDNIREFKMMGGLVFMLNDKMCAGIIKDDLMLRIDPKTHVDLVEIHGCRTMDFTNRPMIGYVLVSTEILKSNSELKTWLQLAIDFNPLAKSSKKRKS